MAQQENDVLLRIQVDGEKALQAVREYTDKVDALKRTQNQLKKALQEVEAERKKAIKSYEDGQMTVEEYRKTLDAVDESENNVKTRLAETSAELGNTTQTLRGYQKELQNVYKQQEALATDSEGSLVSLRAELANATKAFDNLSRAEREGAKGSELLDHITELTEEIKGAEEATQRYQRNVGNYKSALEGAEIAVTGLQDGMVNFLSGGNAFVAQMITMGVETRSVSSAMSAAKASVVAFGHSLKALISNPVVAILAAIGAIVIGVKDAFSRSEEASDKLSVAWSALWEVGKKAIQNFTQFGLIIQGVTWVIDKMASAVISLMSRMDEMAEKSRNIPLIGEYMAEQYEAMANAAAMEQKLIEIRKRERESQLTLQRMENESQELRAQIAEKDKYNANQRLTMVEAVVNKELGMAEIRKKNAEKEVEYYEAQIAAGYKSTEVLNGLTEAKVKLLKVDGDYSAKIRELNSLRAETKASIEAEKKAEEEKLRVKREAYAQAQKEALNKEIEALRSAEDTIIGLISDNFERRRQVTKVNYQREKQDIERRLATEANLTATAREALNLKLEMLAKKHTQDMKEIDDDEKKYREQTQKDHDAKLNEDYDNAIREEIEKRAIALDTELELIRAKNLSELEEQQAMTAARIEAKKEEIANMEQLAEESDEAFYLRQLQANNELDALYQEHSDTSVRITQEEAKKKREAYNSVMQAMDAMGEHSKALGKVAKIMGLAQIAVDTGKAISAGVASASVLPFPANLTAIATTVATVLTNMATALTTIKSAKFATGGLVEGAGSGTSDSVPAMLSNGESVMTAQATSAFAPLLSTLNQMGGGVPIQATSIGSQQMGEDMLARAVARGVAELQPVVSVEEINRVSCNVKVIESLATL